MGALYIYPNKFTIYDLRFENPALTREFCKANAERNFKSHVRTMAAKRRLCTMFDDSFVPERETSNGNPPRDAYEVVPLSFLSTSSVQNISAQRSHYQ